MHKELDCVFQKVIELLEEDQRCKGGWHYGSNSRGLADIYSDYDPVFLVGDSDFEQFSKDIPGILSKASDELLIFWPENYNGRFFKNHCSVIRKGSNLHQIDFFMLNSDYPEDWWCRQHLKGCTRDHIIFDRNGEVAALLDRGLRTDNAVPDPVRAMDTYWFHTEMLIKYFKRKDLFKLLKNIDILFHAHVDLLLSEFDNLDWGSWESKVKHCVPTEKQNHLKTYFTNATFPELQEAIKKCMYFFRLDAEEICKGKGIPYPKRVPEQVISYFNRRLENETW